MAVVDKYAQQKADIHLLVSQQFPFYRHLQASEGSISLGLPDPRSYLENALALAKELGAIASKEPDKFAALVRDGRFRALGKTLPFSECHTYIAEKLYPDDGYAATIEQREKSAQEYALVMHSAVSAGILPMINPHTKLPFDRARLLPVHFQDGLIPINRISECLRKEDQGYIDRFPKLKPVPYRVSQAPEPITPIRGGWHAKPASEPVPAPPAVPNAAFAAATESQVKIVESVPNKAKRVAPEGGDSLTQVIWNICYDMRDAGQYPKPAAVMAKLRSLAEIQRYPLVAVVTGGVKFELEKGKESELDNDALRQRIKIWRKTGG